MGTRDHSPGTANGVRSVVYCLIPYRLAERLHDPLRRHFRDDPGIEVVVDQRAVDRRSGLDRRSPSDVSLPSGERRRIKSESGRRAAERRARLVPLAAAPALPKRLRRYVDRIRFVERVEPSTERLEDIDTSRLIARFQSGDRDVFTPLYERYFDRVYGYLRVFLKDRHEAEDLTQQVFMRVLEALPRYERRRQPFRAWLFVVARNEAIAHLRKHGRVSAEAASSIERRREQMRSESGAVTTLNWVTDGDLVVLIERLPEAQRNVLALKFMLGLSTAEIAKVLGRTENSVRVLQSRALAFLRERLTALGHSPRRGERARMRHFRRQAPVLRARRFSLVAIGPNR